VAGFVDVTHGQEADADHILAEGNTNFIMVIFLTEGGEEEVEGKLD